MKDQSSHMKERSKSIDSSSSNFSLPLSLFLLSLLFTFSCLVIRGKGMSSKCIQENERTDVREEENKDQE